MTNAQTGVMPDHRLREMNEAGHIVSGETPIPKRNIQPASLDLRLGGTAHRLRCSFLPHGRNIQERIEELSMESIPLKGGAVLEVNRPYLVPIAETLALPPDIRARANPRSSIGRLDIFTRVIADRSHQFNEIEAGYQGPLFLEIVSRSFTIRVSQGNSLNQVRLIRGDPLVGIPEFLENHEADPILLQQGRPIEICASDLEGGLPLGVDLVGDGQSPVGYQARRNSKLLDLGAEQPLSPEDFWDPVYPEKGGRLVLEPEEFYILSSLQSVRIPPGMAAEMVALDPRSGEFRTHYAGFFDPGFGHDAPETRAVMEVRPHDVPFMLEHGQQICRIRFERLTDPPDASYGRESGSSYQGQGVRLSKHFRH